MHNHDEIANRLEQLLESLIKMVGRGNQNANNLQKQINQVNENMESLQKRISQLEWLMKTQLDDKELDPIIRIFPTPTQTHSTSDAHDKIPLNF